MLSQFSVRHPPPADDVALSTPRKRRRKALSCNTCRKRKLKCNREYPACERCVKAGYPQSCQYSSVAQEDGAGTNDDDSVAGSVVDENAVELTKGDGPSAGDAKEIPHRSRGARLNNADSSSGLAPASMAHLRAQSERIAQLEHRLELMESRNSTKTDHYAPGNCPNRFDDPETMTLKGAGFETRFFGFSHPISVLAHAFDIREFMKESVSTQATQHFSSNLKAVRRRAKTAPSLLSINSDAALASLIPDPDLTDRLIDLHFSASESFYCVLHEPTFRSQYTEFRTRSFSPPGFVPVLLSVLSINICLLASDPSGRYLGESTTERARALTFHGAAHSWVSNQSNKHPTIFVYQTRILLLLSEIVNDIKPKQHWLSAGELLRLAAMAGLHREPDVVGDGKSNCWEKEMRRRLWGTVRELELQVSLDRGFSVGSLGLGADARAPRNLDDEDLQPIMNALPPSRPNTRPTKSRYLHISHRSFAYRADLTRIVNANRARISFEELLSHEERISAEVDALSKWSDGDTLPATLLRLQYQQFLLLLYTPFTRASRSYPSRAAYSRAATLTVAGYLISEHTRLSRSGIHALNFLRMDVFRAAMFAAHAMYPAPHPTGDLMLSSLYSTLSTMLKEALETQANRLLRVGRGFKEYWYTSAVFGFFQTRAEPHNVERCKRESLERIGAIYAQVLGAQEEIPVGAGPNDPKTGHEGSNGPAQGYSAKVGETADLSLTSEPLDPALTFMGNPDLSDWTLDNIWSFDLPMPDEGQEQLRF
ncbi:hypothetical protein BDY21DRAFT_150384 [Lineolata rhizophorae]|uniref:Zn(2)-C6 fungal-type domain-containing protein n=1 Tax=Lineolata rhizophorae TaxID=578093 RepID=A0A6A6NMJ4_9PEZI|nr:hypothetical protein BDY21DRAFT_150384 [Lineolata rhizophorae]